jgi:hypothetical protein
MRFGIAAIVAAFLIIIGSVVIINSANDNTAPTVSARVTRLADYAENDAANVSLTLQGPLVGDDQFKAIRITINKSKRTAELLSGYAGRVENRVEFANSSESFASFTRALDNLSFGRERDVKQPDERGLCPQSYTYIYRVTDGSKEVMRTWSNACSPNEGPFGGKTPEVIHELFRQQITDYYQFSSLSPVQ